MSIDDLIKEDATKYGVNETHLYKTLQCESANFTVLDGQSEVVRPDGTRENSWGIAQFNLPTDLKTASGEEITKEVATDPEEAIDAAAYNFSKGYATRWSCYNLGVKNGWPSS